ncbi:hypothetical protein [Actinoallomurus sp. NPDC052274]|uniref:hypothetical protein n=1 Tax=Actinoallomurus sp. NPDC052274 TaxID=3155420 RepID=UPI003412173E
MIGLRRSDSLLVGNWRAASGVLALGSLIPGIILFWFVQYVTGLGDPDNVWGGRTYGSGIVWAALAAFAVVAAVCGYFLVGSWSAAHWAMARVGVGRRAALAHGCRHAGRPWVVWMLLMTALTLAITLRTTSHSLWADLLLDVGPVGFSLSLILPVQAGVHRRGMLMAAGLTLFCLAFLAAAGAALIAVLGHPAPGSVLSLAVRPLLSGALAIPPALACLALGSQATGG